MHTTRKTQEYIALAGPAVLLPDDVRATLPRLRDVIEDGLLNQTNPMVHALFELEMAPGYIWRWWVMAIEGDSLYGISQTVSCNVEPAPHLRILDEFSLAELAQLRAPNGNAVRRVEGFEPQKELAIREKYEGVYGDE